MPKKLSPKQSFLLLYLLTGAGILISFLLPAPDEIREFYGLPLFLLPFPIIIATFFAMAAMSKVRIALSKLDVPKKYSPKHFLLLLWLSVQAFLVDIMLHTGIYALFIGIFGWGFWDRWGDEPVFFIIALCVVPAGVVMGAVGRMWQWAVVQPVEQMKARGIQLPTTWRYFAPFGSYVWLWKFSKGIEAMTARKIWAAGVFASVLFLGIVGFIIIRHRLVRVAGSVPVEE